MTSQRIDHWFFQTAQRFAAQPAVISPSEVLTYGQLANRALHLAHLLAESGARPNDAIGFLLGERLDWIAAILGCLRAGCIFVPLDPSYPRERLAHMLAVAKPRFLYHDAGQQAMAESLVAAGPAASRAFPATWPAQAERTRLPRLANDGPCYIYFTSGSTGKPKAILGRHKSVRHFIAWEIQTFALGPHTRISQLTTPSFDAFLRDVFAPLCCGGSLHIPPADTLGDGARLLGWLSHAQITQIHCVPSVFRTLLAHQPKRNELSHLTHVLMAGEPLLPADVDRWISAVGDRVRLVNLYGPSETTMVRFCYLVKPSDRMAKSIPIGQPIPGARAFLLDPKGQPCRPGEIGRMHIATAYATLGYLGQPRLTAAAFTPVPDEPAALLYDTGDLARQLPDGDYQLMGRVDRQVKIRGVRVELEEIENVLRRHPKIQDAALIACHDGAGSTYLAACLVAPDCGKEEPRAYLSRHLPANMVPSRFVFMPKLPLSPNGKLDHGTLTRTLEAMPANEGGTNAYPEIATIFAQVLGHGAVGPHENFFHLGGHSLLATQVVARLLARFGKLVPLAAFFDNPTVAGIGAFMDTLPEYRETPGQVKVIGAAESWAPLSPAQRGVWFIDQLEGASAAYNIHVPLALQGPLCPSALRAALEYVVHRHGALRTALPTVAGEPRQVVSPPAPVALNLIDLGTLPDELQAVATRVARQPFRLDRGPLWRALLVRIEPQYHVLCLTLHHIISDGWSMNVLRRDLFAAYRVLCQGRTPHLPPLQTDFLAYARDRYERESSGQLKQQLEWWTALLDGAPQQLLLSYAKPRPTQPHYRGDRHNFELEPELGARLGQLATERGVTPYMILLAAFAVQLGRHSGKRDIVIGTPIANRTRAELEPLIGFFVNTLAPRINLSGNPSFSVLLERVRKLTLEAYNYQDVPFEKVVETVNPTRQRNVNPIFQVMFILQNVPRSASTASELKVTPQDLGSATGRTKFDLTLSMSQTGDLFKGSLRYAVECFEEADMVRFGEAFTALLGEVLVAPDRALFDEDLRARDLVLHGDPAPYHQSVQDGFHQTAQRLPRQLAVETPWTRLTYAELAGQATGLAQILRERGLRKGHVIAVITEDAAVLASAALAVLELGACLLPLETASQAKFPQLLAQVPPELAIVGVEQSANLELSCPWLYFGCSLNVVNMSYQPLVPDPDALACIFFTPGQNGQPRAVAGRAAALDHYPRWAIDCFALQPGTRFSQWAPFDKDEVLRDLFLPLCLGGTLVQAPRNLTSAPAALLDWGAVREIQIVHCAPSLLRSLLAEGLNRGRWPALRALFLYGESVFPQDPERWFSAFGRDIPLVNLYGATETQLPKTFHVFGPRDKDQARLPVGKPLPGIELWCINENGEAAETGEVVFSGATLALGYLDDGEVHACARDLKGRPCFRTGDLGRIDDEGRLVLLGRKDRLVKVHGARVALDEVEALLLRDVLVDEACVQVRQDSDGNGYLCAFLVGSFPSDYDPAARLAKSLPAAAIPSVFAVLPQLPRLAGGKVDHKKLAHHQIRRGDLLGLGSGSATNSDHVAELMRTIWAGVLQREDVDFGDDFFRLGGHSLLATVVVNRVREALGVQLSLGAIFEQPTLAGQIKLVDNLLREGERASAFSTPILADTGDNQLSSAQQRLWVLQQLTPGLCAYNMSLLLNFTQPFTVKALERALYELVARHKILRTTFPAANGRPISQIQDRWRRALDTVDMSQLGPLKSDLIRRLGLRQVMRPFQLEREQPIRATLVRLDGGRHMLLLSIHHIACDEVSLTIIKRELRELLQPLLRNHVPALPPLPVQYNDFASWQRKISTRDHLHISENFWREQLLGAPPLLDLPLEKPRPRDRSYRGAQLSFSLDEHTSRQWITLCRDNRVTVFMGLLACFKVLLAHYCRSRDIVVGSTVSLRDSQKLEPLVGLFINTLVLRTDLRGTPSFREILAKVRQVVLETHQHRHTPFEHLVEVLHVDRNPSYNPLFQVMFIYREDHGSGRQSSNRSIAVRQTTSKFDLTLTARKGRRGFKFLYTFDRDLFGGAAIKAMRGHLLQLLRSLPEQLDGNLFQVPICTERERERLLYSFNDSPAHLPGRRLLHHLIEDRAGVHGEREALVWQERRLTYAELLRLARGVEARLGRLGIGPEQNVAVCMPRCPELVAALLGILMRGAAYVPMDPAYPRARLRYMLEDAAAVLVVGKAGAASDLADLAPVLDLDQFQTCPAAESSPSYVGEDSHAAYIQYTSGSTGRPKGVVVPHRGPVAFSAWAGTVYDEADLAGVLAGTSICFDLSVFELFTTLALGGRIVLNDSLLDLARLPAFNEVTLINSVPSAVQSLFVEGSIPRGLRVVNLAGEAFPRPLVDLIYRHPSVQRVFNLYGPTEDTTYSTGALLARTSAIHPPIGRALRHKRMYLLDPFLKPVPLGVPGEVYLAGAGLARGYLNRPALTALRFLPDPFDRQGGGRLYRTGDLARWLPSSSHGTAVYLGRIDHQIKIRGFRIELGEVESVVETHALVARCAVLLLQATRRPVLAAFVQLAADAEVPDLSTFLAAQLPTYMVPSHFKFMELPLTQNGKIDRKALAALVLEERTESTQSVPPRNDAERTLVEIWRAVLNRDAVGIFDNFFELGGDSIMGIQVIARAARAGLHLSASDFLHHQTVAAQAGAAATTTQIDAEQGAVKGPVAPLPIAHWLFESTDFSPNFFNQSRAYHVHPHLSPKQLELALNRLLVHHDALRTQVSTARPLRLRQSGKPKRLILGVIGAEACGPESELVRQIAARCQLSLDLTHGPLLRACLVRRGDGPSLLLLAVHHLVVDGVSWRILAADLERLCADLVAGREPELGPKTTSLKSWSQRLRRKLGKGWMNREAAYWRALAHGRPTLCPRDQPGSDFGLYQDNETHTFSLNLRESRALLQEVPKTFQCSTVEALMAALARTLCDWCNQDELLVNTEGHGRENLFPDVDLSRTVGWFTSLYPVRLTTPRDADPARLVKAIRDQLRAVPHKGLGFGICRYLSRDPEVRATLARLDQVPVCFNYLGRTDEVRGEHSWIWRANQPFGLQRDPAMARHHLLDLNAYVRDGKFSLRIAYCSRIHRTRTIRALGNRFLHNLRAITNQSALDARTWSPSDFPLARLTAPALSELLEQRLGPERKQQLVDVLPFLPLQRGMLYHGLLNPSGGFYHEQWTCTLKGELDLLVFGAAWQQVFANHQALRCIYFWEGLQQPLQVVIANPSLPFRLVDLVGLDPREQELIFKQALKTDRRHGFHNEGQLPHRFTLFRLAPDLHRFVWSYHHMVCDGWSLALVRREVFQSYERLKRGTAPKAKPGPRLHDFLAWFASRDREAGKRYWQQHLAGFREPTPLPGWPSAEVRPSHFRELKLSLPAALTRDLELLARGWRVTVNALVQAMWAALLHTHSGKDDLVFGFTAAIRPPHLADIEALVGLCINTLPNRVLLDPRQRLDAWLRASLAQQTEAREFGYCDLADIVSWSEAQGNRPLFESILVFENYPRAKGEGKSGGQITRVQNTRILERGNYPLALIARLDGSLTLRLIYDAGCVPEDMARLLPDQAQAILQSMVDRPEGTLAQLELLSPEERQQLLIAVNEVSPELLRGKLLHERVAEWAQLEPEALALIEGEHTLTYGQLQHQVERLAQTLLARGIRPEDRIGVQALANTTLIVALLGAMRVGAVYIPLNPAFPPNRRALLVADADCRLVIAAEPAEPAYGDVPVHALAALLAEVPQTRPLPQVAPEQAAYLLYTSGSTGVPKGVVVRHRGLAALAQSQQALFATSPSTRVLMLASPSFDASIWEIAMALYAGGRLVLSPHAGTMLGIELAHVLGEHRVTHLTITPAALGSLPPRDLPFLECLVVAGDACPPNLIPFWSKGRRFFNAYGPTETTVCATAGLCRRGAQTPPIGRAIPNTTVHLLDPFLRPLPLGCLGEIYIGGVGLARGYHGRPAQTARSFVPNPFASQPGERLYRSGDLARWLHAPDDELPALVFAGRRDQQVKLRGKRIELGEIEATLCAAPGVSQAVVFLSGDSHDEQKLVAFLACPSQSECQVEAVKAHLSEQLPDYMVPTALEFLAEMPLTPHGKIDRTALRQRSALVFQKPLPYPAHVPAANELERAIAEVWSKLLKVKKLSVTRTFSDLGGNSLLLLKLHAALVARLEIPLSLADLFNLPTVRSLAQFCQTRASEAGTRAAEELGARERANLRRQREAMRRRPARFKS